MEEIMIVIVSLFLIGLGVFIGNNTSTNTITATQYSIAQDKCKDKEGIYSVKVSGGSYTVYCKNNDSVRVDSQVEKN